AQQARAEQAPVRRLRRALDRPLARRAAMTAGGGLWLWVSWFLWTAGPTAPGAGAPLEPTSAWSDVSRPFELYMIASPDLADPTSYAAQRHKGGGRRDTMTFGEAAGEGPHSRMTLYRVGAEQAPVPSFWVEMARRAADGGLSVERTALPDHLKTRFGNFETADVVVSGGGAARACMGFRLAVPDPDFRVSGFACGPRERPIDRRALSCLIDRLDLVSAGDDKALSLFFARSEADRQPECFGARGARTSNWLAPQAGAPALRAAAARVR
ncbi:MAG: hypothetical protein JWN93_2774, partial [Hyphomicrobiales bacterium]|nr:hypothetical protein [Hyphomicrobiales bacterium]